jgi:hypothetical protein
MRRMLATSVVLGLAAMLTFVGLLVAPNAMAETCNQLSCYCSGPECTSCTADSCHCTGPVCTSCSGLSCYCRGPKCASCTGDSCSCTGPECTSCRGLSCYCRGPKCVSCTGDSCSCTGPECELASGASSRCVGPKCRCNGPWCVAETSVNIPSVAAQVQGIRENIEKELASELADFAKQLPEFDKCISDNWPLVDPCHGPTPPSLAKRPR